MKIKNIRNFIFIAALIVNATCVLHNIAKQYNIADVDIYREDIEKVNIEADEINENMQEEM